MSLYDQEAHWFAFDYWRANWPDVRLNYFDNAHVDAGALRVAWTGPADRMPIVAVQFTPRSMQAPSGPMDSSWMGIASAGVGLFIPGGGLILKGVMTAAKLGVQIEQGLALQDLANTPRSPDEFSPQYSPAPFLLPMPLDRAQIMVQRPWYAPAMVYQFQQELVNGNLRTTPAAYAAILQAMLPAGTKDPPPSTKGEAPLFSFVNPLGELAAGGARLPASPDLIVGAGLNHGSQGVSPHQPAAARPSAAPLIITGGLLLLGAPIVVVAIAGAALFGLGRKA